MAAQTAEYVAEAKKWLPKILALGNDTGNNTSRQLAFYSFDEESEISLATTIMTAMLNDCPNARQEALLAVAWNEPLILREKLEEMYGAAGDGGAAAEEVEEEELSDEALGNTKVNMTPRTTAAAVAATSVVVHVQARVRGYLSRKRAQRQKEEKTSMLCIALDRGNPSVVDQVLEHQGSKPDSFRLDVRGSPPPCAALPHRAEHAPRAPPLRYRRLPLCSRHLLPSPRAALKTSLPTICLRRWAYACALAACARGLRRSSSGLLTTATQSTRTTMRTSRSRRCGCLRRHTTTTTATTTTTRAPRASRRSRTASTSWSAGWRRRRRREERARSKGLASRRSSTEVAPSTCAPPPAPPTWIVLS